MVVTRQVNRYDNTLIELYCARISQSQVNLKIITLAHGN